MMSQIPKVLNRIAISLLIIILALIASDRTCELRIKSGTSEIKAIMACGS